MIKRDFPPIHDFRKHKHCEVCGVVLSSYRKSLRCNLHALRKLQERKRILDEALETLKSLNE